LLMVNRERHDDAKRFWRFRERMHEGDWPQSRLVEYEIALFKLKGLRFDEPR
jgi:hypothetical protein